MKMSIKDTTKILAKLRTFMKDTSLLNGHEIAAYIIPSSDAHGSEYLCEKDKRRQFISGFTGSSGTAVLTNQTALLWTDGRYYLQATQELDSNWQLMKDGLPETPSIADWLVKNLPASSRIGIDATLYEEDLFTSLANKLKTSKIELEHIKENLVDLVWKEYDKPMLKPTDLIKLKFAYTGKKTSEKLAQLREQMEKLNCDSLVVTSLDELAWLLNLRGADIPFGTVFFAYCIVTLNSCKLFTDLNRLSAVCDSSSQQTFRQYLLEEEKNFEFYDYDEFYSYFADFVKKVYTETNKKKIFLSSSSNHAIHSLVTSEFIHKDLSLILKAKVIKNNSEIESARAVHVRDSTSLVEFFYLVDKQFDQTSENLFGVELNEFDLAKYVDDLRATKSGFFTPSFETICSFGSNGSIIHYKPDKNSDKLKKVEQDNLLLLDSGGHYLEPIGTTDVTRTVFVGVKSRISAYQKECFTRVLKGHIQLSSRIFPSGIKSELLDSFARQSLWQAGLDYRHGTGHGVGALLNVHEMPIIGNRRSSEIVVEENMIVTIEPGYYEDGNFGIRIENCVLTVKANTKYKYAANVEFIRFEPLTYVPLQRDLIDKSLLTSDELDWINEYHEKCLSLVGEQLKSAGKAQVYEWLVEQTKPL